MTAHTDLQARLNAGPRICLLTGFAGLIGSNLLETLLTLNQRVGGLDNFSTGHRHNFDEVQSTATKVGAGVTAAMSWYVRKVAVK